jgi:RHS repeat-associated protein
VRLSCVSRRSWVFRPTRLSLFDGARIRAAVFRKALAAQGWNYGSQASNGVQFAVGSEQVLYYHTDALGSVRMITDANGQIYPNATTRYDYLPFGTLFPSTGQESGRLFTGQERDAETKLDYFGARQYARTMERFTSPDPLTLTPDRLARPDRLNRYAYANLNPLRFTDPQGLSACDPETGGCDDWSECPGWLFLAGCGWYEGLLGFDPDGYLINDFTELSEFANWLRRRGTAPVTAEDLAAMRASIVQRPQPAFDLATVNQCVATNIAHVNRVSALGVDTSHVLDTFVQGGAINVNFSVPMASPTDLRSTRYLPPGTLGVFTGIGPSLHVPPPQKTPGRGNRSSYGMDPVSGNFTFTTHLDTAWAFHPTGIGVFVHWFKDVRGSGAYRRPC